MFVSSNEANRKKKEIKDAMGLRRAPLLNYETLEEGIQDSKYHRTLTERVTKLTDCCVLCYCLPCPPVCPLQYRPTSSVSPGYAKSGNSSRFSTVYPDPLALNLWRKTKINQLRFISSIEKIKTRNAYQMKLIKRWQLEGAINDSSRSGSYQRGGRSEGKLPFDQSQEPHHRSAVRFRAMSSAILPLISKKRGREMVDGDGSESKITIERNRHLLPKLSQKIWKSKKQHLERLSNKLVLRDRCRQKWEAELPQKPQPCAHQLKSLQNTSWLNQSMASTVALAQKLSKLKRQVKPITSKKKKEENQLLEEDISEVIEIKETELAPLPLWLSTKRTSPKSPSAPLIARKILIQVTEVVEDNKPSFDMNTKTQNADVVEKTKLITITANQICEGCWSRPCMNLKRCPITKVGYASLANSKKQGFLQRKTPFGYLFGLHRLKDINNKLKRVKRHECLGRDLRIPVHKVGCRGEGACKACREDQIYSRAVATYQQTLLNEYKRIGITEHHATTKSLK